MFRLLLAFFATIAAVHAACTADQKFDDETGNPCPVVASPDKSEPSITTKDGNLIVLAKKV